MGQIQVRMKLLSVLALALLLVTLCEASGCPVSTCSTADRNLEMLWLNTSTMMASIKGTSIVFYPRQPNGDIYELMQASLSIDVVGEITHDSNGTCYTQNMFLLGQYIAANRIPRYLSISSACCEASTISDIIEGNIARERVVINVTYPLWPDFYLEYTISTYNDTSIIQKPATPNIGTGYNISMIAQQIKLDVKIYNWPWITDEKPLERYNDTFLQFFFTTYTQLDEKGLVWFRDANDGHNLLYSAASSKARIDMDFLKIVTADGVDYFSYTNDLPGLYEFPGVQNQFLPAILSLCQGNTSIVPRYKHLSYDPNLSAIFLGDTPITTPANAKKNRLHPAVYAVPVAVACSVVIGAAIYAFVVRPKLRAKSNSIQRASDAT